VNNEPFLRDLRLFCMVARKSSFAATAAELGASPAYVSKRIATLEAQLRCKLLHRTTRRVGITDDGETVYQWAQKILDDVEGMEHAVSRVRSEPRGLVRISTSLRLGREHLAPALSLLRKRYPELEIWLELLDRRADLIAEGFDLDIRVGDVSEPHLIAHRIVESSRVLCAAPAYVRRHGVPKALADLARHACLLHRERDQTFGTWRMQGPNGWESVRVTGPMASNHSEIVRRWALDGHGVIMVSVWDIAHEVQRGALVRVLPAYRQPADVWAVSTARVAGSAKFRACLEFLTEQLTAGPYRLATVLAGGSGAADATRLPRRASRARS
jgi:LysR family transcriptional activator of dmlA